MSECETCRYKNESWDSEVCDGCTRADSNYEADLISRKDTIDKAILVPIAKVVPEDKVIYRKVVFIEDIESLPSAEPKIGKWIDRDYRQVDEDGYETAICSNCKAEITLEYPYDNYCPKCGAKMEGEDDE